MLERLSIRSPASIQEELGRRQVSTDCRGRRRLRSAACSSLDLFVYGGADVCLIERESVRVRWIGSGGGERLHLAQSYWAC